MPVFAALLLRKPVWARGSEAVRFQLNEVQFQVKVLVTQLAHFVERIHEDYNQKENIAVSK